MNRASSGRFLWIEAAIYFGPLAFVVFLGLLIFPVWISMFASALTGSAPWVDGAGRPMWDVVRSIAFVSAAVIGLVGLIRVLLLLSGSNLPRQRPTATIVMVAIGVLALISFHVYRGHLGRNLMSFLVYFFLPTIGSIRLLYLARAVWLPSRADAK